MSKLKDKNIKHLKKCKKTANKNQRKKCWDEFHKRERAGGRTLRKNNKK